MAEKKNLWRPSRIDIQIGVTILLCLVISDLANRVGIPVEALAVTTGSIMCVQDSTKAVYTTSLIRMLGVTCGGLFGVVIAGIDNAVGIPHVFYLMVAVGVVVNMLVCKRFGMPVIQARVSSLTLLLVVMVFDGVDRFDYAISRFVGSLVGAVIALLVTVIFAAAAKKRKEAA